MRFGTIPFSLTGADRAQARQQMADDIRTRGTSKRPQPPRNLIATPGARKILLTWSAPDDKTGVAGYRVYKGSESDLYEEIKDPNRRQCEISATAGAKPPVVNLFVVTINPLGIASTPSFIQGVPTAEAAAPADPPPPSSWSGDPNSGGGSDPDYQYRNIRDAF